VFSCAFGKLSPERPESSKIQFSVKTPTKPPAKRYAAGRRRTSVVREEEAEYGRPPFLEFFAGSGLVAEGMRGFFRPTWANDFSGKKADVYRANFGSEHFHLGKIEDVRGADLPSAVLAWASFPCQDLSLAGNIAGIEGKRSGLAMEWLRVIDEMGDRKPPILVAENVSGLVSANEGANYRVLHEALKQRGYRTGALELDAIHWVAQSRPRIFVVSVRSDVDVSRFSDKFPSWAHSGAIIRAALGSKDFIWWKLPRPTMRETFLEDIIDFGAECQDETDTKRTLSLISPRHQSRLLQEMANGFRVAPGYKRTRDGKQVMELRFDRVAGCLRTPEGGSSRQFLVLKKDGRLKTRLLSVREAARLMGVRDDYKIPGSYNDGYRAMGDAVAVPVVRHLAEHLLNPLSKLFRG
jgi:DNA (cytosine-5)-methyltransferase 1